MEQTKTKKRVFTNEHKQRLKTAALNRGSKYRKSKTIKIIVIDNKENKKLSFFQKIKNGIKKNNKKPEKTN